MHEVAQWPTERRSPEADLYYKFTREKVIDICYVGLGVNYHSLSYWSTVMTSPVEFSTGEFRAKHVWNVPQNGITNEGKKKRLRTKEKALSYDSVKFSRVTHKFYPPSIDTDCCFNYFDLQSMKVSDPVRLFSLLSLGEIGRHMYVSMLRLAPPTLRRGQLRERDFCNTK